MEDSNRRYSDEEVSDIIRRALGRGSHKDTIDHAELMDIAKSSGISPDELRAAIEEEGDESELDAAKEDWLRRHRREFSKHLTSYCIINGFLFFVNLVTGIRSFWVIWPIMGWGVGIAFHYFSTFHVSDEQVERGARRLLRRKQWRMKWERGRGQA
jgi:hypothetical protein